MGNEFFDQKEEKKQLQKYMEEEGQKENVFCLLKRGKKPGNSPDYENKKCS